MKLDEYINQPVAQEFIKQAKSQGLSTEEAFNLIHEQYQKEFNAQAQEPPARQLSLKDKARVALLRQQAAQSMQTTQNQRDFAEGLDRHPILGGIFGGLAETFAPRTLQASINKEPIANQLNMASREALPALVSAAIPETKAVSTLTKASPAMQKALSYFLSGARQAGAGAVTQQGLNVASGEKINPSDALAQTAIGGGLGVAIPSAMAGIGGALQVGKTLLKYPSSVISGASPEALTAYGMGDTPKSAAIREAADKDLAYGQQFQQSIRDIESGKTGGDKERQIQEVLSQSPPISTIPGTEALKKYIPEKTPGYPHVGSGVDPITGKSIVGFNENLDKMLTKKINAFNSREIPVSNEQVLKDLTDNHFAKTDQIDKQLKNLNQNVQDLKNRQAKIVQQSGSVGNTPEDENISKTIDDMNSRISDLHNERNNLYKDYLQSANKIAEEFNANPITSSAHEMPASRVLDYRRDIDKNIPWGKPDLQPYEAPLVNAFKHYRSTLKNQLIESAQQTGQGDKYNDVINSWAKDLDMVDKIREAPGGRTLESNPQGFINQLHNPAKKQLREAVKELTNANPNMPMADIMEKALNVKLAKSLGMSEEQLTPSWTPTYKNGGLGGLWTAVATGSKIAPLASPRIAAYTLGAMDKGAQSLYSGANKFLNTDLNPALAKKSQILADLDQVQKLGVPLSEIIRKKKDKK